MPRSLARELITPGLHVDRAGLYGWTAALNTVPVVGAVAWGIAAGELDTGLLIAAGALFTGIPGLGSPPRKRMTAMAVTAFLVFVSTFVGVWTGATDLLAMAVMALWAFGGAMLGCLGRTEGLIGATAVLSLLLVAQYPDDFEGAVLRALLALAGCLGQVALTVAVWRIARDRPQRDALGAAYARIAALARAPRIQGELLGVLAELRAVATTVQDAEGGRAPRSPRGRARRTLLRDADAIVLEIAALRNLGDQGVDVGEPLRVAAEDLDAVAVALRAGHGTHDLDAAIAQGDAAQAAMRTTAGGDPALRDEAMQRVDHLRGHLRAAWRATAAATGPHVRGRVIDPAETRRRLADARGVLRANLTLDSATFRHAVRLGAATAVGVGVSRLFDIPHGYWIPLTVLFVLRPDFGSTFSRGGLRAVGTILGILLAGAVTWALGGDDTLALIPIAVFCWGALAFLFANYALFTTSITALVVLMVDLAGEPAVDTMGDRLVASAIGIVIALISFLVWPTWSRERMVAAVGQYVDALRVYAVGVLQACVDPASYGPHTVDPLRMAQRLARANADDALASTLHEPQHRRGRSQAAQALLGAGYHVHEAAIVLDVHVRDGERDDLRPGLTPLVQDVDATLAAVERWWTQDASAGVTVGPTPVPPRDGEPALVQEIRALAAAARAMACATRERQGRSSS